MTEAGICQVTDTALSIMRSKIMTETTNTHFICLTMVLFPDSPAPGVANRKNTDDDLFTCRRKVNKIGGARFIKE